MIRYEHLRDIKNPTVYKKRKRNSVPVSDTIYSFDIEVSNMFYINGKWQVFNKELSKHEYIDIQKCSLPYIWQFGINDTVYYGRNFSDFEKVLIDISDSKIHKIIWVHNLSYEFQFLLNIFADKYTIENMISRDIRKPISFDIKELNISFRCSYMLTNLSLEAAAKEYTSIKKLDSLEYDSMIRTPLTRLTMKEKQYCEYDVLCVYEIIKHFREEYKHIANIPYTSTGIVRQELKKHVDYYYIRKMQNLVPDKKTYLRLWACFSGGYTHANILNACRVFKHINSYDISSSYPYTLVCERLPAGPFLKCPNNKFNTNKNRGYIALIRFIDVKHKMYNHYMQNSKCIDPEGLINDNGRVCSVKSTKMWLTNIDFELIMQCYYVGSYEVLECYSCYMAFLDERIIKFILKLYGNKTKLKGVEGMETIYKRDKAQLNSIYGMAVTNPLKQSTDFNLNEWTRRALTDEFIDEKLEDMRKSFSTLLYYAVGVFVTSYSRKHLLEVIFKIDKDVIYCDTDSIKYKGDHDNIFEEYNKSVDLKYKKVMNRYPDLKEEDFKPVDKYGKCHPIGYYEKETEGEGYEEFKTLGAKKYVVRENGKLKMTLSGVSKSGVVALNDDIEAFQDGMIFDYETSGKLQHTYIDDQPEVSIDGWYSDLKYGIVLQPTTYTIGITELYELLVNEFLVKEAERRTANG